MNRFDRFDRSVMPACGLAAAPSPTMADNPYVKLLATSGPEEHLPGLLAWAISNNDSDVAEAAVDRCPELLDSPEIDRALAANRQVWAALLRMRKADVPVADLIRYATDRRATIARAAVTHRAADDRVMSAAASSDSATVEFRLWLAGQPNVPTATIDQMLPGLLADCFHADGRPKPLTADGRDRRLMLCANRWRLRPRLANLQVPDHTGQFTAIRTSGPWQLLADPDVDLAALRDLAEEAVRCGRRQVQSVARAITDRLGELDAAAHRELQASAIADLTPASGHRGRSGSPRVSFGYSAAALHDNGPIRLDLDVLLAASSHGMAAAGQQAVLRIDGPADLQAAIDGGIDPALILTGLKARAASRAEDGTALQDRMVDLAVDLLTSYDAKTATSILADQDLPVGMAQAIGDRLPEDLMRAGLRGALAKYGWSHDPALAGLTTDLQGARGRESDVAARIVDATGGDIGRVLALQRLAEQPQIRSLADAIMLLDAI